MTEPDDDGALSRLRRGGPQPDAQPDETAAEATSPATVEPPVVAEPQVTSEPAATSEPPVTSEPEATAEPAAGTAGSSRRGPRVLVALLLIIAVAAAAVLAVFSHDLARRHRTQAELKATVDARAPLVAAAVVDIQNLFHYDYRQLPQDEATARAGLTPSFMAAYDKTITDDVAPNASKVKAVTTASVKNVGIVSNTATSATLLVFIDQDTQNSLDKGSRLDQGRARVTMLKQHGKWLVNGLTTL